MAEGLAQKFFTPGGRSLEVQGVREGEKSFSPEVTKAIGSPLFLTIDNCAFLLASFDRIESALNSPKGEASLSTSDRAILEALRKNNKSGVSDAELLAIQKAGFKAITFSVLLMVYVAETNGAQGLSESFSTRYTSESGFVGDLARAQKGDRAAAQRIGQDLQALPDILLATVLYGVVQMIKEIRNDCAAITLNDLTAIRTSLDRGKELTDKQRGTMILLGELDPAWTPEAAYTHARATAAAWNEIVASISDDRPRRR